MLTLENVLSLQNLSQADISQILDLAESLENVCAGREASKILENKIMATFFYEASTRTRLSFETAMLRLGGQYVSMADAKKTSSVWKGETLADTIRTIHHYADVIVLRHASAGAAEEAAKYSDVPVINAGDGTNEHPTQGLLDMLTIRKEKGSLDGLKVGLVGDLKHTRSTNSLTIGLSSFDVELALISPPGFETSDPILDVVKERGVPYQQVNDINEVIEDLDVLYVCRIQKERLKDPSDFENIAGTYVVNRAILEKSSKTIIVMHHLPRVGELSEDVDDYPGAAYFKQPFNGVLVRAALLSFVLGKADKI